MSESGKVVVTKSKLDGLANAINDKAKSPGPKTIAQLTQTVNDMQTDAPVTSVNGKTGAVTLSATDVSAIPSTLTGTVGQVLTKTADGQEWKDAASPQPSTTTPLAPTETGSVGTSTSYARGDHVHPKQAVTKSDVGLGNVDNVRQYSASNPPPYPVTSVNGATGEVKSTFYVTVTQGDDGSVTADKTAEEVYAAYEAGYAVYAIVKFSALDVTLELPLVLAERFFETFTLGFGAIGSQNPKENPQYPTVSYTGTRWMAWIGTLAKESDIPTKLKNPYSLNIKIGDTTTSYDGSEAKTVEIPNGVPSVTTADNGKFLRVVNGGWAAVEIANANGGSF